MNCSLSEICDYVREKIDVSSLDKNSYISTENMIPNKGGVKEAASLPDMRTTQAYKAGDVLVSNIRPYFRKIWKASKCGGCSNDILVLRAKPDIDSDYLFYVVSNNDFFDYATATSKGTKMPRGDKKKIMEYNICLFPLSVQRNIVSILKPIDDKIELNNAINKNLEQQARALFESWFVDYESFEGKVLEGWRSAKLGEIISITCGKRPNKKSLQKNSNFNDVGVKTIISKVLPLLLSA